jgi:hypothetical protein
MIVDACEINNRGVARLLSSAKSHRKRRAADSRGGCGGGEEITVPGQHGTKTTIDIAAKALMDCSDSALVAFGESLTELRRTIPNMKPYHEKFPVSVEITELPLFEHALAAQADAVAAANAAANAAVSEADASSSSSPRDRLTIPSSRRQEHRWHITTCLFEVEYYYHCEADGEEAADHSANAIIASAAALYNTGLVHHLKALLLEDGGKNGSGGMATRRSGHERRSAERYYRLVNRCIVPLLSGEERVDSAEYHWIFILLSAVNNLAVLLSSHPSMHVNRARLPESRVTFEELYYLLNIAESMIMSKERSMDNVEATSWWDGMVKNCTTALLHDQSQQQEFLRNHQQQNLQQQQQQQQQQEEDDTHMSGPSVVDPDT